jgi:hypothetical protein
MEAFAPGLDPPAVESAPPAEPAPAPDPALAPAVAQAPNTSRSAGGARISGVNLTFYDCLVQNFCGAMYNGEKVYEGAAACSWNLPIGTRFYIVGDPTGRLYVCKDRGMLTNTWIDVFFYAPADGYRWQAAVGRYGTIEIVSTP